MSGEPILEVEDLEAGYGQTIVLRSLNLSIKKESIHTILGPNGAGKTTLMRVLTGLLAVRKGCVRFRGKDITHLPTNQRVKMGITLVPEGRGMLPALSVMDNLLIGTYSRTSEDRKAHTASDIENVFELFPRLRDRRKQISGTLSGGEMQMLAVGRALMAKPSLLLLDEPTLGLAPGVAKLVIDSLDTLRKSGLTIIVVEQKSPGLLKMSDELMLLKSGQLQSMKAGTSALNELISSYFGKSCDGNQ